MCKERLNKFIKDQQKPVVITLRFLAIFVDLFFIGCIVVSLQKIWPILRGSELAIAFFAAAFTVLITFIFDRLKSFIDKHKSRYDDMVYLERELNICLTVIDDNIFTLKPFLKTPISPHFIMINPDQIEINKNLINHMRNLLLINELVGLLIDFRKMNSTLETIKQAYDRGTDFIKASKKFEQIKSLNEYYRDEYIEDIIAHLKHLMTKTEHAIAFLLVVMDRAFPNIIKYLLWFFTDWILSFIKSYKGLFLESLYIDDRSLAKEISSKYLEFKKGQAENIKKSKEEIEAIKSSIQDKSQ